MARIPEAETERLKREVAIERLVMGFGVELKRHGAELIGTCPFHEDKTQSLVVSPTTNRWHCQNRGKRLAAKGMTCETESALLA